MSRSPGATGSTSAASAARSSGVWGRERISEFAVPGRADSVTPRAGQGNGFLKIDPYVLTRGAFEGHHYQGAVNTSSMSSFRPLNDLPSYYLRSLELNQSRQRGIRGPDVQAGPQQFPGRGNLSAGNINRYSPNSEILP